MYPLEVFHIRPLGSCKSVFFPPYQPTRNALQYMGHRLLLFWFLIKRLLALLILRSMNTNSSVFDSKLIK